MAAATIKPMGALSLLGVSVPQREDDPRIDQAVEGALSSINPSSDQAWRDEQLAFAGGMTDPSGNGSFGGALTNAFKSQSEHRTKQKELQLHYLPTILNAVTAAQTAKQAAAITAAMAGPGGSGFIGAVSSKYNIAPEAIYTDLLTNEGKGVREMIYKNSTPDYAFQDGALIDKNPVTNGMYKPGGAGGKGGEMSAFQWTPGVTTSSSGQSSLRLPDPDAPGGVRIVAPKGAVGTFKSYEDARNQAGAEVDLETVTPRGENPQMTTRADLLKKVRGGAGGPPRASAQSPQEAQVRGNFSGTPEQIMADIETIKDPAARDQARRAYANQVAGTNPAFDSLGDPNAQNQTGNQGAAPAGGALAQAKAGYQAAVDKRDAPAAARYKAEIERLESAPPSVGLELQSPAEATRQTEAVQTEQKQFASNSSEMRRAQTAVSQLQKAIALLGDKKTPPTSSGIGAAADTAAGWFGKSLDGAPQADQLKTIQGWLTSNVPRMEGPQSNFDVANYQQMTGMVGNDRIPLETRLAAAKQAMQLIMDAAPKEFGSGFMQQDKPPPGGPAAAQSGGMPTLEQIRAEMERRKGTKK